MSHLSSCGRGINSRSILRSIFGLQLFDLNLGSTLSPASVPSLSHLRSCGGSTPDLDPTPDLYLGCTFWPEFSLYWYYVNPMLSSKFNILSHNSFPSGQIWKISSQAGLFFPDGHFEYQQPYVIFKFEHFTPYFCLSQYYLLHVYITHNFYCSSAILMALYDNLELTVFM